MRIIVPFFFLILINNFLVEDKGYARFIVNLINPHVIRQRHV